MGKGSKQRPTAVPENTLSANWERAFAPPKRAILVCALHGIPANECSCQGLITLVEASD